MYQKNDFFLRFFLAYILSMVCYFGFSRKNFDLVKSFPLKNASVPRIA